MEQEFLLCNVAFMKVKAEEVTNRVDNLLEELRMTRNEASTLREKAAVYKASIMASKAISVGTSQKVRYIYETNLFGHCNYISMYLISSIFLRDFNYYFYSSLTYWNHRTLNVKKLMN